MNSSMALSSVPMLSGRRNLGSSGGIPAVVVILGTSSSEVLMVAVLPKLCTDWSSVASAAPTGGLKDSSLLTTPLNSVRCCRGLSVSIFSVSPSSRLSEIASALRSPSLDTERIICRLGATIGEKDGDTGGGERVREKEV